MYIHYLACRRVRLSVQTFPVVNKTVHCARHLLWNGGDVCCQFIIAP